MKVMYTLRTISCLILVIIYVGIGLTSAGKTNGYNLMYNQGLIQISNNRSFESHQSICMVYPTLYYTLDKTPKKLYKFTYENIPDVCQGNLTAEDFKPRFNDSLLVLSTSMECSIIPQYYEFIQEGNASSVILLSNNTRALNESYELDVFAVVQTTEITKFMDSIEEDSTFYIRFFGFKQFDVSLILLGTIAVLCVAVGSFIGPYHLLNENGRERLNLPIDSEQEASGDEHKRDANGAKVYNGVTIPIAIGIVIFISSTLLLLYFFYQYLVYVFIFIFCIASPHAMYSLLMQLVKFLKPRGINLPRLWKFGVVDLIVALICAATSITWFIFRHEPWVWCLQDILGSCFCIHLIQTLHLPNMKIITVMLILLFIYDIFFVFITPYFTDNGKSVMVEVATGGDGHGSKEQIPLLLLFPRFQNNPASVCISREYSLLGYGDIIVPGLLVCFAHRFDLQIDGNRRFIRPYFITSVIAYSIGLSGALVALLVSSSGQPALFYIVPAILFGIFGLGLLRKEVKGLWQGFPDLCQVEPEP